MEKKKERENAGNYKRRKHNLYPNSTKIKKEGDAEGKDIASTSCYSRSVWSNYMGPTIFNIFTTIPLNIVIQKLKIDSNVFLKYNV